MDQRGRLQGVLMTLAGQTGPRELSKFVVHFRQQLARRAGTAVGLIRWVRCHAERTL
jgi:hypothetical protein